MTKSLFLVIVGAAVLAFLPQAPALADRDREEVVRWNELPREVQNAIERERDGREVKRTEHVVRDGREFYRALIDHRGRDVVVRFDRDGHVLGREDVADRAATERVVEYNAVPRNVRDVIERERRDERLKAVYEVNADGRTFYRAIFDARGADRMIRVAENGRLLAENEIPDVRQAGGRYVDPRFDDRGMRREFREVEAVDFNRLPGPVKASLGNEAGSGRITRVVHYRSGDIDVYRASVDAGGRTRFVRVDGAGRFVGERETTAAGTREVNFRDLPGAVKDAVGREVPRDRLGDIYQVTRDGRTSYRVEVDDGPFSRWLLVDDAGRVRDDTPRRR